MHLHSQPMQQPPREIANSDAVVPATEGSLDEKRRKMLADAEMLAGIGSFEWDIAENKVTWSDGLYAIYGLAPDEFSASFEAFLAQVHPDDRDMVQGTIQRAYRDAQPFSLEERIVRADGSVRMLRSKGEVVTAADGTPERLLGVCQDITEAKQSEKLVADWNRSLEQQVEERTRQLAQANAKLEEALERQKAMQHQILIQAKTATVGNLVAGVAHEVNTPVGAITSANDVVVRCVARVQEALTATALEASPRPDLKLDKVLETLNQSSRAATIAGTRLTEIVDRLKFLSQLDEAPQSYLDLHEALDGILTFIRHKTSDRIRITKSYGELSQIWCDPGQLNQALMSLLLNASQAIDETGEIHISTWTEDGCDFIRISDTGRGIGPEKLERLFDIGFNDRGSKVRLGTGLFNAYNIVQKHGGEIEVESELGEGATFTIRLPHGSPTSPGGLV